MTPTSTAIDWNQWRADYDTTSFAAQQAFYDQVFDEFPSQARFSVKGLAALLKHIGEPVSVVEIGGWDGEFAAEILRSHPELRSWMNYEISGRAVAAGVCADPRYYGIALHDWYWKHDHTADVLVASHVIEHLKLSHVIATVAATDCQWIYFQAPLSDGQTSWHNYRGSHILGVGWGGVTEALEMLGFGEVESLRIPNVRCYAK